MGCDLKVFLARDLTKSRISATCSPLCFTFLFSQNAIFGRIMQRDFEATFLLKGIRHARVVRIGVEVNRNRPLTELRRIGYRVNRLLEPRVCLAVRPSNSSDPGGCESGFFALPPSISRGARTAESSQSSCGCNERNGRRGTVLSSPVERDEFSKSDVRLPV